MNALNENYIVTIYDTDLKEPVLIFKSFMIGARTIYFTGKNTNRTNCLLNVARSKTRVRKHIFPEKALTARFATEEQQRTIGDNDIAVLHADYDVKVKRELNVVRTYEVDVEGNRQLFLSELRSGKYKKGTTKSDEHGYPVFETESDKDGYCACAVMVHLFGGDKYSLPKAVKELGLVTKDCRYIQTQINDTPDSFSIMADRIEREVFQAA